MSNQKTEKEKGSEEFIQDELTALDEKINKLSYVKNISKKSREARIANLEELYLDRMVTLRGSVDIYQRGLNDFRKYDIEIQKQAIKYSYKENLEPDVTLSKPITYYRMLIAKKQEIETDKLKVQFYLESIKELRSYKKNCA